MLILIGLLLQAKYSKGMSLQCQLARAGWHGLLESVPEVLNCRSHKRSPNWNKLVPLAYAPALPLRKSKLPAAARCKSDSIASAYNAHSDATANQAYPQLKGEEWCTADVFSLQ